MKTCILIASAAALAAGSALEDRARGMAPGSWDTLATAGLNDEFLRWPPGHYLQWTDRGAWDPVTRRFLFLGGAHAPDPGNKKFMSYSEADNAWRKLADPPFLCVGTGASCIWHGYEHITLDAAGRELYYRPFNSAGVYRYDLDSDQWKGALPPLPEYSCCGTLAYFPERKSLVYADGHGLQEFDFRAGKWSMPAGPKQVPMGDYGNMGVYDPVHRAFFFGGGNDSSNFHRFSADGSVKTLRPTPFPMSTGKANLMADPWDGSLLLIGKTGFEDPIGLFYRYDHGADRWEKAADAQPLGGDGGSNAAIAAAPIPALGALFILRYDFGKPQVFLYKSRSPAPAAPIYGPAQAPGRLPSFHWDVLGRRSGHPLSRFPVAAQEAVRE